MARTLRSAHNNVNAFGSLDVAVVDVEAVSESKSLARLEVLFNMVLVNLGLLLVGNEDHNEICFLSSLIHRGDLQASLFCDSPVLGAFAKTNANVNAGILQVQCVCMALRAVADDSYLHALDYLRIDILFVIDRYSHGSSLLLMTDCYYYMANCIVQLAA